MKSARFEYRVRGVYFCVALMASALLFSGTKGDPPPKLVAAAVGMLMGYLLGLDSWRRLRRQIDRRNVAVTYFEDTLLWAVLAILYFLSVAPRIFFRASFLAARHPTPFAIGMVGLGALCTGYTWVMFRRIRNHERRCGPLRIKTFYARSVVGPEGMIGRTGKVVEPCAPEGRIQVGAELWNARSLDGSPILAGEQVVIRDIEGLWLIVEGESGRSA